PAQIWNRFMSRALRYSPALDFAPPKHEVVWRSFRGRYAFSYGYVPAYEPPSTTDTATTEAPPVTYAAPSVVPKPVQKPRPASSSLPSSTQPVVVAPSPSTA